MVVVDSRRRRDYDAGHLPGAVFLPVDSVVAHAETVLQHVGLSQRIVVYCHSSLCDYDVVVASRIKSLGYSNVAIYSGGGLNGLRGSDPEMKVFFKTEHFVWAARIVLGSVFLLAGYFKAVDPYQFMLDIRNYGLVPGAVVPLVTGVLPWVEMALGMALLLGVMVRGGFVVAAVLTAVFVTAQSVALVRGLEISCGCLGFGAAENTVSYLTVLRTTALLLLGLFGLVFFKPGGQSASV